MKARASALALLFALGALLPGCAWFEHRPGVRVEQIDGLERIEFDGLDVSIYKTSKGKGSEKRMQVFLAPAAAGIGGIREAQSAALRIGDVFYLKDKDDTITEYELLSADQRDIAFRRQVARQQHDTTGTQTIANVKSTVVRVKPYPVESEKEKKP